MTGGAAFAYLLFILLYTPCVAAMGAYVREFGPKFARFIGLWTMFLAYASAVIYYQATSFAAHPLSSSLWIGLMLIAFVIVYIRLKQIGQKEQALRIDVVNIN